jgi:hypothetical protein
MLRIIVFVLLLLGAQFSLTAFAPAHAGKGWILWPFAADSKAILGGLGGLPQQGGSVVTPFLAGLSGLGFLLAALALFGVGISPELWTPVVIGSVILSVALHVLYFSPLALVPILVDLVLLWGTFGQQWTAVALRGW